MIAVVAMHGISASCRWNPTISGGASVCFTEAMLTTNTFQQFLQSSTGAGFQQLLV